MLSVTPQTLVDTNEVPDVTWRTNFSPVGDKLVFVAGSTETGRELWSTDGTAEGTGLLFDVNPGPASSFEQPRFEHLPYELISAPDRSAAFFIANLGDRPHLWRTDGAELQRVFPGDVRVVGVTSKGALFYQSTVEQTVIDDSEDIVDTRIRNDLYFADGQTGAVSFLDTITHLDDESHIDFVGQYGDTLLLSACDLDGDVCVDWKSDGTAAGTSVISTDGRLAGIVELDGQAYGWSYRSSKLHPFDGQSLGAPITPNSGEIQLTASSVMPTGNGQAVAFAVLGESAVYGLTSIGEDAQFLFRFVGLTQSASGVSKLFYLQSSFVAGVTEQTLWVTDGTTAGTSAAFTSEDELRLVRAVGDNVLFTRTLDDRSQQLWQINGSNLEATKVIDIPQDDSRIGTIDVEQAGAVGDPTAPFVFATEHVQFGKQFWAFDGTSDLADQTPRLLASSAPSTQSVWVQDVADFRDGSIFSTREAGPGQRLDVSRGVWFTDGTPEGTVSLAGNIDERFELSAHVVSHGVVIDAFQPSGFSPPAPNPSLDRIWISDGQSPDQARPISDLVPELQGSMLDAIAQHGDQFLFLERRDDGGRFWSSDGSSAGTRPLIDVPYGQSGAVRHVDGLTYFVVLDRRDRFPFELIGSQIYVTDGTFAGTTTVDELPVPKPFQQEQFSIDGRVYFQVELTNSYGFTWAVRDPDGSERIVGPTDFRIGVDTKPIVIDGNIYFLAEEIETERTYVMRLQSGRYPLTERVTSRPVGSSTFARVNNKLLVRYDNGQSGLEPAVVQLVHADTDSNGWVDNRDLQILCRGLAEGKHEQSSLDVNLDGTADLMDVETILRYELKLPFGDANFDGRFDSSDLVQVFANGRYENREVDDAEWTSGDWNCDGEFDSSDLVMAMVRGGYDGVNAAFATQLSLDLVFAAMDGRDKQPSR